MGKGVGPQSKEKLLARHAKYTIAREPIVAAIEQVTLALGIIFSEVSQ